MKGKSPREWFGYMALAGAVTGPGLTAWIGWPGVGIWAVCGAWFGLERYLEHVTQTHTAAVVVSENQAVSKLAGKVDELTAKVTRIENRGSGGR